MLRMQNKRKYSAESHSIAEKEAEEGNGHLSKIAKWDLAENCIKALDKVAELVPVDKNWSPINNNVNNHFDDENSSNDTASVVLAVETADTLTKTATTNANVNANSNENFNNNNNTIDNNKKIKFINGLYSNTNELLMPLKNGRIDGANHNQNNVGGDDDDDEGEDDDDEDEDDDDDEDDDEDDDDEEDEDDDDDNDDEDIENEHFENSSNKNCWKVSNRSVNTTNSSSIENRNYSNTSQQVIIKEDENGRSYLQLGNMKQTKCLASLPNTPSLMSSTSSASSSSLPPSSPSPSPTPPPQSQPQPPSTSSTAVTTSTTHQMPSVSMSISSPCPSPSPLPPAAAQTSQAQSFSSVTATTTPPLPSFSSMPSNHAHANSFFSQHPFRKTNPADKYTHCCDTIEKSRVCNNHCYNQKRLSVLNLSMCKLAKFRQNSDSSLIKSVLICNTLRYIEKEMESEGNQYQQHHNPHHHHHHHHHHQQQQQQQQHQQQQQQQQMFQTQQMQESQQQMVTSQISSPTPLQSLSQPQSQQSPVALPHLEWLHVSPSPVPLYASVTQSVLQMPDFVAIEDDNVDDPDTPLPSLSSSFSDYIVPLRSTVAVPVPVTVAVSEYYENSLREMSDDSGRMTPFPCSSSFPSPSPSSYSNDSSSSLMSMQSSMMGFSTSPSQSPSQSSTSTATLTLFDCQNNSNNNNGDFMDCSDSDIADSASCTTALHSDFGLDSGFDDEDEQCSSINWSTVLTLTSDTHLENLSHNMEFYSETGFSKSANFFQVTSSSAASSHSSDCLPSPSPSPSSCSPPSILHATSTMIPTSTTTTINSNFDGEWEEFVFYDNS